MAMDSNNLVFIDVEATAPAIKVEEVELPEKKVAFSPEERQLIVSLVEQFPVIRDKRITSRYIVLKNRAWERITMAYNAQSFVARRTSRQLKRCWENMKSRKMVNGHTSASSEQDQEMEMPSFSESNTDTNNVGSEDELEEKKIVNNIINKCSLVHKKMNLADEVDIRVKRCAINIQHDEELHKLRVDREALLIERELMQNERDRRLKKFEDQHHELQLEKLKLEIELLKKQIAK